MRDVKLLKGHTAELGFEEEMSINFACKNLAQNPLALKPKTQYLEIPIPKKAIINLRDKMSLSAKVHSKGVYEPFAKELSMHPPLGCPTEFAHDELDPRYTRIKNFRHVDVIEQGLGDEPLLGEEGYWAREHVKEGGQSLWPGRCHDP
jgi:hypothetical protein